MKIKNYIIVLMGIFVIVNLAFATELNLSFVNSSNEIIAPVKAEILTVAWGDTRRFEIEVHDKQLKVPLDPEWLNSKWPERFKDLECVYLFIKFQDYCSIRSNSFLWIGAHGTTHSEQITKSEIIFPNGQKIEINKGETKSLQVNLRKPSKKFIRLIDEKDQPIPGVSISSDVFWSTSNHMGVLLGAENLGVETSDNNGFVNIKDGDFEYAIVINHKRYILQNPINNSFPNRFIGFLNNEKTVLKLSSLKKNALNMRVKYKNMPFKEQILFANIANCNGACSGPLSTTDNNGEIKIDEFSPEIYNKIFFLNENGKVIWELNPLEISNKEMIEINIK